MNKLTPDARQEEAIELMLAEAKSFGGSGGVLNGSEMGVGKTLLAVETMLRMWARRALVIAPLSTFDGWSATLDAQSDGQTELRPCANKALGNYTAKECKENLRALLAGERGYFFLGREHAVTLDWGMVETAATDDDGNAKKRAKQKGIFKNLEFDYCVVDESHRWSNRKSRGFKTFMTINADLKCASSGTFFSNKIENAWSATRPIFPNHVSLSFYAWKDEFCKTEYAQFEWDKKAIVGEKIPGAFVNSLPCYIHLKRSDVNHKPTPDIRHVDLSPEQRKAYDDIESTMVTFVENDPIITELPITMRIRLRQLSLGMFHVNEDDEIDFRDDAKSTKFDELKNIMADIPDEKILIFTDSAKFARVVTNKLNARKTVAGLWSGQVSQKDREAVKASFLAEDGIQYIVAVIAAAGTGVDQLQTVCSTVVFLSESESGIDNEQAIARIDRKGQQNPVKVYKILARNTYDEGVMDSLLNQALQNNASRTKI